MNTNIAAVISFIIIALSANAQAKPLLLSSIKPLTLIAQEIAGDSANTDTLLPVTASPHDYPLKASDHSRLHKADLIVWVGPELESFLQKPLSNFPSAQVITTYNLPRLNWSTEAHMVGGSHVHERDPHIWLDPRNAVVIAQEISKQLMRIDPAHEASYVENYRIFAEKMSALDTKLSLALKPVAKRGFAVYHEGYGHFVNHYGLHQLDYVTFTPEQRPGAKHLHELRQKLVKEGGCLFMEPYYERQAGELAKELSLKTGILDALASNPDIKSYGMLMERMSEAFVLCLSEDKSVVSNKSLAK